MSLEENGLFRRYFKCQKKMRVYLPRCACCVLIPGAMQLYEGRAALSTGVGAVARKSKADKLNPRLTYCRFHITFQSGSQVCCQLANLYVSKFGSWAGTSQQSSQVHFKVRTLIVNICS